MDTSDETAKPWDHPWSTEEMRKKRREWSLAGDAGLLKHLQEFSENLMSKATETQEELVSLTTQLNETTIFIDNITNTSLALANTQFIESRVQEDNVDLEKPKDLSQQKSETKSINPEELLAKLTENIRQGLRIMDERYERVEVVASDSEDEGDTAIPSAILRPKDPYQDHPLPYVIGSEKWRNSTKIGLESSSSSESEHQEGDEDDESPESEDNVKSNDLIFDTKLKIARLSSSSSDSDDFAAESNSIDNSKISRNQNVDSDSDLTTPSTDMPKVPQSNHAAPSFAEELAKRLGSVLPEKKVITTQENDEPSINRAKEDVFTPEDNEDMFSNKSENLFTDDRRLFDDELSNSLWKNKPVNTFKSNIIPASIDVPPPISTVSTQPKSALDDLFGDNDSEDSDDIFSSKSSIKKPTKEYPSSVDNISSKNVLGNQNFLDIVTGNNMKTSTPETNSNTNAKSLFSDEGEEDDNEDLFASAKKESFDRSENVSQVPSQKKPIGGVSILDNTDLEKTLSSRILRRQSTSSSNSDETSNQDGNSNIRSNDQSVEGSFIIARGIANNFDRNSVSRNGSGSSSGISIQPSSVNNTGGSSIGEPQMTSSRLKSDEIYRERVASDSLFVSKSRFPAPTNHSNSPQREEPETSNAPSNKANDSIFDSEDVFGPPALPGKADKSQSTKYKVQFLFEDSDSGDDLFSNTSSGSKKSSDFLSGTFEKSLGRPQKKSLFDDDTNVFDSKDSPDVDLFGRTSSSKTEEGAGKKRENPLDGKSASFQKDTDKLPFKSPTKSGLFEDSDDEDLFGKPTKKNEPKLTSTKSAERSVKIEEKNTEDLFSSSSSENKAKDSSLLFKIAEDKSENNSMAAKNSEGDKVVAESKTKTKQPTLFSKGLFDDDEDDDDDLFGEKKPPIGLGKAPSTSLFEKNENSQKKESRGSEVEKVKTQNVDEEKKLADENSDLFGTKTVIEPKIEGKVDPKVDDNVEPEREERKKVDQEVGVDSVGKREPPKTLNISNRNVPEEQSTESAVAPKKPVVSGKIKDLMGKMGDLKILSPTDSPPALRKSEEKTSEKEEEQDEEDSGDRDSDDGGSFSTPIAVSPRLIPSEKSPPPVVPKGRGNSETAVSFDVPAQVETLSTAASKSRARIQAKRRPQSRQARQTALRQSGIDFDTVDTAKTSDDDTNQNLNSERLTSTSQSQELNRDSLLLGAEDKSELNSLSKGSSMSINKNTLLSPSTDEEDLFDVPPDLPEDPQKEDALFGRAPIISPVESAISERIVPGAAKEKLPKIAKNKSERSEDIVQEKTSEESGGMDPLRDENHDPLKDPSQLFAFVTKTPSPEKAKSLYLQEDDDSLFFSGKKSVPAKKEVVDLFADDDGNSADLFTVSKPVKILRDTKINNLFEDDDENDDDNLFGRKKDVTKEKKSKDVSEESKDPKKSADFSQEKKIKADSQKNLGLNLSDDELFSSKDAAMSSKNVAKDIFEQSSGEEDIFSGKKNTVFKKSATKKSLFGNDDDDDDDVGGDNRNDDNDDIFGISKSSKKSFATTSGTVATRSNVVTKKPVTRDLKKTAEKIVADPLSMLQDD